MCQLDRNTPVNFESFFTSYSKQEVVTTFMALLELMKKGVIHVEQEDNYSTILLYNISEEIESSTEETV